LIFLIPAISILSFDKIVLTVMDDIFGEHMSEVERSPCEGPLLAAGSIGRCNT
jgi:hypothetical protein